jgi:polysaccharide pyruvyl transferase WcaK-like protein
VRILVDQSGYDLLNIGDVAMLQSCITRLRRQWPDAEIMVIAHAPMRLASYCPGTIAVSRTVADLPLVRILPQRPRLASEQAWKMAAPYLSSRVGGRPSRTTRPRTAVRAVQAADLVVASGGGYVTDTWWWHAAGVLSMLSLAQRLGKPTAMFGQGIGPIGRPTLRVQAGAVLPKLKVIGLREDRIGRDLMLSLGMRPDAIRVTGDDALELISGTRAAEGNALGFNVRVSGYAGVEPSAAAAVGDVVLDIAATLHAPIVGLPVSRYASDADIDALRALLHLAHNRREMDLKDIASPEDLVSAAANCRVIVTGSYHAAVFGLAQGVPAVCLTKSCYYDAKFAGLRALFPGACFVVPLDAPDWATRLRTTIPQAWHLPYPARAAAKNAAVRLRDTGQEVYAQFRLEVDRSTIVTACSERSLGACHHGRPSTTLTAFRTAAIHDLPWHSNVGVADWDGRHGSGDVLATRRYVGLTANPAGRVR